jgi:hypothetical protein
MSMADNAVTIPDHACASTIIASGADAAPAVNTRLLDDPTFVGRYALGDAIGEGGMGEVRLCGDRRIGRDVAIKTVRAGHGSRSDLVVRFLREACVQGQLEHPAIVPVYDLGRDPDGRLYFTMKRILGVTFERIVDSLRAGDPDAMRRYTRRKLLTAFASVCQAVHFAHARGVVHRDLKPGNVMLGDFGEVYVLDWGLAKVARAADPQAPRDAPAIASGSDPGAQTMQGAMMGTPGYMAPEQVRGEEVDARADVYALGAMLFELLARQPLHKLASLEAAFASTLTGADARPSARAPALDLPPELDAICVRATAIAPADRFASARELVDALERYLDGDRDLELRRGLALEHARTAGELVDRALAAGEGATEARSDALRELGRAIALDPNNADAVATLGRLLTEPPRELPAEVHAQMAVENRRSLVAAGRASALAYLTWFLYAPFILWMGVRSWLMVAVSTAAWLGAAATSYFASHRPQPEGKAHLPMLLSGTIALATTGLLLGPYVLLPGLAVIETVTFIILPPNRARIPFVLALGSLAVLVPIALSWAGVFPACDFSPDAITIHSGMLHFPPLATQVFLIVTTLGTTITAGLMLAPVRRTLTNAEHRMHVQSWQLKQLVPREARDSTPPAEADLCTLFAQAARANRRA